MAIILLLSTLLVDLAPVCMCPEPCRIEGRDYCGVNQAGECYSLNGPQCEYAIDEREKQREREKTVRLCKTLCPALIPFGTMGEIVECQAKCEAL